MTRPKIKKFQKYLILLALGIALVGVIGYSTYALRAKTDRVTSYKTAKERIAQHESEMSQAAKSHYLEAKRIADEIGPLQKDWKNNKKKADELNLTRIEELKKAAEIDSYNPLLWSSLANAYTFGNPLDSEQAAMFTKKAIELEPDFYAHHVDLAFIYLHLSKEYDFAVTEFKRGLELNPNCWECESGLAQSYYTQSHYKESLWHAKKALYLYKVDKTKNQSPYIIESLQSSIERSQEAYNVYKK